MIKCKFIRCNDIDDLNIELLIFQKYYNIINVQYISNLSYINALVVYKEKENKILCN